MLIVTSENLHNNCREQVQHRGVHRAPIYSITLSARSRMDVGTITPAQYR
jgi:hypothetical protein